MSDTVTDERITILVATTLVALADLLEAMEPAQWDAPSACEGWLVRHVVAHMTMPARYDEARFTALLQDDGWDFTRTSDRIAATDATLPESELVANLRDPVLHRWVPPGGGVRGALNHAVIHALDVTVPLGVPTVAPDEALRFVLDDLTAGGVFEAFGVDIAGRAFRATDLAWSFGAGDELAAAAGVIALRLCGRR